MNENEIDGIEKKGGGGGRAHKDNVNKTEASYR